jgi:Arc/MetJ-type ribon-helix-helix transcriptional regulator
VFDKDSKRKSAPSRDADDRREGTEDARIALRCNRKELQLVDSFVANGEFETRSELMRAALHAFLRSRAMSTAPTASARVPPNGEARNVERIGDGGNIAGGVHDRSFRARVGSSVARSVVSDQTDSSGHGHPNVRRVQPAGKRGPVENEDRRTRGVPAFGYVELLAIGRPDHHAAPLRVHEGSPAREPLRT